MWGGGFKTLNRLWIRHWFATSSDPFLFQLYEIRGTIHDHYPNPNHTMYCTSVFNSSTYIIILQEWEKDHKRSAKSRTQSARGTLARRTIPYMEKVLKKQRVLNILVSTCTNHCAGTITLTRWQRKPT